ncbi:MAG: ROK family protein [Pirellulales bacterium]
MPDSQTLIPRDQATPPFFVGVDLGGTNIKLGVVDDRGRTLDYMSTPTEPERGGEDGARRMGEAVLEIARRAGLRPDEIAHVGLGSPGTMDVPAGMLLEPFNLGWYNFPIRDRLSQHCGRPVAFNNDANAAAYGEYWVGSGRDLHSMVLFTLGTGVGCGVIIGDLLVTGENSHGAECGHIIIDYRDDARVCSCEQSGHLEAYASATAVVKRIEEVLATGRESSVGRRVAAGEAPTPLMLSEEAERGDALAMEIILETARYVGVGAVSLIHTIDPNGVVLGGAMTFGGHDTAVGRRFLTAVRAEVDRRLLPTLVGKVSVDLAQLGGDAGYLGAAGIARLAHQDES